MELKEMMGKKKAEKDPAKKDAKMEALKAMRQTASDMMRGGMHDKIAKVSVLAKNPEDLAKGLDKAKDLVKNLPMEGSDEEEAAETPEQEAAEGDHYEQAEQAIDECSDPAQLDDLMQKIADKKRELMMKKA